MAGPRFTPEGEFLGYVGSSVDITEIVRAEQILREVNATLEQRVDERTAELERSNHELDQFAYVASHDLRAPLRDIELLASFISEDAAALLPTPSQRHLALLRGRIKRLDTLLLDLLSYSRAGRQRHKVEQVEVAALLQDVIDLLNPPPGFQVELVESMPTLLAERTPLATILRNLVSNAIRHHDRPNSGRVTLTVEDKGEFVEFAVADNGPGIDPAFHTRIFEMFQTLKPRDQVEGSGLGLALVKRLVESRNGTIRVESSLGHGTTFRFTWPKG
jgi:signal transduction histidine kinase